MCKIIACLLFASVSTSAIAADADAPIETVIVDASTLAGIWKIGTPSSVEKSGVFSAIHWGPMHDQFCRFSQDQKGLTANCFRGRREGVVTLDGAHIHIAWGTMMARMVLDGVLQSANRIQTTAKFELAGMSFVDPELSNGAKIRTAADTQDAGGKASLLRDVLTSGIEAVPHDADAIRKYGSGAGAIPKLGAIDAIAWLGQQTKYGRPDAHEDQVDYFSVYAVEFDSGERICGLHQRVDGVLDAFLCL